MFLAIKNGNEIVCRKTLAEMTEVQGIAPATIQEVDDAQFKAQGGLARLVNGQIVIGRDPEEVALEEARKEYETIKGEIASRDYRALKAQKLGEALDDLYPGETDWYKAQLERLGELEGIIAAEAE